MLFISLSSKHALVAVTRVPSSASSRRNSPDRDANGAPGRSRTCDPRFRKPMLYPAELRARMEKQSILPRWMTCRVRRGKHWLHTSVTAAQYLSTTWRFSPSSRDLPVQRHQLDQERDADQCSRRAASRVDRRVRGAARSRAGRRRSGPAGRLVIASRCISRLSVPYSSA